MPPDVVASAPTGDAPGPRHAGTVALVGRPNVGKSTLLNRLVGQKVSITSPKAQTTRHRITGILTTDAAQFVFVDTPGFQTRHKSALNRVMNRAVRTTLADVDVVVFVIEALAWTAADRAVLDLLPRNIPVVLAINKVDGIKDKAALLPFLQSRAAEHEYAAVVPLAARTGHNLEPLLAEIAQRLPEQPLLFDADALTDRSERFLVAELIREKVFRLVGAELPYGSTVTIEKFEEAPSASGGRFCHIYATILIERAAHKTIVIGAGGSKLKAIGSQARADIERLLDARVHLELWVKVKAGWNDDESALHSYGYD